jgi:CRP-like cAMP-binding protein
MKPLDWQEIKQLEIFEDLSPAKWDKLHPLLHPVSILEGEELFREGDRAHTFYIILSGHFMIHYRDGRAVTIDRPGDVIGWSTVVRPFRYTATVTSLTRSDLLSIPGERFFAFLQSDAETGERLIKKINGIIQRRQVTG